MTLKRQRPQPLEPRSGSGVQGAGPRPRLATDLRHHPRLGRAVQTRSARAQAQPGLPAGRAVSRPPRAPSPPPAPTTHPREEGRAAPRAPGVELPPRASQSRVLHCRVVQGLKSGSRAGAGLRAIQKLRPSWGSQDARPAAASAPAQRPEHSVNAPSCSRPSPGSQPPSLPAFRRVINCISGVEKPGPGVPGCQSPGGIRGARARPGAAPS